MKKIWARISMELEVSDEEAQEILQEAGVNPSGGNYEFDINKEFAKQFIEHGVLSDDSYIPEDCIMEI